MHKSAVPCLKATFSQLLGNLAASSVPIVLEKLPNTTTAPSICVAPLDNPTAIRLTAAVPKTPTCV